MENKECETIVFSEDKLGKKLWEVVSNQIQILCESGYHVKVYEEEKGIIVVEFNHGNQSYGCPILCWVKPEIYERIPYLEEELDLQ